MYIIVCMFACTVCSMYASLCAFAMETHRANISHGRLLLAGSYIGISLASLWASLLIFSWQWCSSEQWLRRRTESASHGFVLQLTLCACTSTQLAVTGYYNTRVLYIKSSSSVHTHMVGSASSGIADCLLGSNTPQWVLCFLSQLCISHCIKSHDYSIGNVQSCVTVNSDGICHARRNPSFQYWNHVIAFNLTYSVHGWVLTSIVCRLHTLLLI